MHHKHAPFSRVSVWGTVIACWVGLASDALATVIVDNWQPEFTILYGSGWITYNAPGQWGTNYLYRDTGEPVSEVEWRPVLPGGGETEVAVWYRSAPVRPNNAHYTIHHAGGTDEQYVDQTQNGSQWVVLGVYPFTGGNSGCVTLTTVAEPDKKIVADAVRFRPVSTELVMVANPAGWGWTVPAEGGPYPKDADEVVPIEATVAPGREFRRWEVSAGSAPADPYSPTTTVTMDVSKTVTAVFGDTGRFRGLWADAFGTGFRSPEQVDEMIANALAGNYNAIVPEVLVYHDPQYSTMGAWWKSNIVARAGYASGNFDPLGYMVQQAHANGLEVHPWLLTYQVSLRWPPPIAELALHPEWLTVPRDATGTVAPVDGVYRFDPGSPDVQEYLVSIVRELVTDYEIDGIHWDYVRYVQTDAGYPADLDYTGSTLARFQAITGRSDVPASTGDSQWNNFRRRTITELVRRVRVEIAAIKSNPRQPLRHTAALITWGDAPADFSSSSAYSLFQNWPEWMAMGYLDAGMPMAYFDETAYATWYRNWVDAATEWRYDRHMYIGPGLWLNPFADSVTQMSYALNAGADGINTYSYRSTNSEEEPFADWYPYVGSQLYTNTIETPEMPWRDPATATEGTVFGRVTVAGSGAPIDDASVVISGLPLVKTDGNGFYAVTMAPASGSGTDIVVGASSVIHTSRSRPVTVLAGDVAELNIPLGTLSFGDYDGDGDVDLDDYPALADCLTGPASGPIGTGCDVYDADSDDDIDLLDFAEFQAVFADS